MLKRFSLDRLSKRHFMKLVNSNKFCIENDLNSYVTIQVLRKQAIFNSLQPTIFDH